MIWELEVGVGVRSEQCVVQASGVVGELVGGVRGGVRLGRRSCEARGQALTVRWCGMRVCVENEGEVDGWESG